MRIFLSGIGLLGMELLIGYFTHDWKLTDNWMLRIGMIGCVVAFLLTFGATGRGSRMGKQTDVDKEQKKNYLKFSGLLFSFSIPSFIVALVIYYATHP